MASPLNFDPYGEDPMFQSSYYTQDISEQMRVPKRIKATGEHFDEGDMILNGNNGNTNSWNYQEKFDMTVPDRIMFIGQEQHHGTRSAPREIDLENSIMKSPDRGSVRVSTPPRSITLDQHHFPSASDEPEQNSMNNHFRDVHGIVEENEEDLEDEELTVSQGIEIVTGNADTRLMPAKYFMSKRVHSRESTPPLSQSMLDSLTPSEELLHLRKNIQNLRARVITLELDNNQRQQRDKIWYCIGIAYFLIKAFNWLKNN